MLLYDVTILTKEKDTILEEIRMKTERFGWMDHEKGWKEENESMK